MRGGGVQECFVGCVFFFKREGGEREKGQGCKHVKVSRSLDVGLQEFVGFTAEVRVSGIACCLHGGCLTLMSTASSMYNLCL